MANRFPGILFMMGISSICHAQTAPAPLEFKGVPLGATMEQLRATIPEFDCRTTSCFLFVDSAVSKLCGYTPQAFQSCRPKEFQRLGYGPAIVQSYEARFRDGQLARVDVGFHTNWFASLTIALTEKFGTPASDTKGETKNRMGASFENRTITWERPDGFIRAEQRYGSVDTGHVTISTKEFAKVESDELEKKAKEGAKNL